MTQLPEVQSDSQVEIVKLPVLEWQKYKEIRLRSLKDDPQAFGSNYDKEIQYQDDRWKSRLESEKYLFFAKLGGQIVGMVGAFQTDQDKTTRSANVFGVFVASEARGKSVSTKLMEKLLDTLKGGDVIKANLSVNKDQQSAVGLYKRLGFEITGEENVVLGDGLEHAELLMSKQL